MKKLEVKEEAVEEVAEAATPTKITADFGSEGLNALRDAVNALLDRA